MPALCCSLRATRSARALLMLVLSAGLAAGCARPTPYLPADSSEDFGYREQQVASDRWRVRFSANSVTDRETVENYLLFRAAELTVAQRREWFVVTDRDVEPRNTYYRDDGPRVSPSVTYGSGGGFGFGLGISTVSSSTEYFAAMSIRMLDGAPAADEKDAYEANDVIDHLLPEVRQPVDDAPADGESPDDKDAPAQ